MHRQLRVSFTKRRELLAEHIDICSKTLEHMVACAECTDDAFCPVGTDLYEKFKAVKARARLVTDTDVEIDPI